MRTIIALLTCLALWVCVVTTPHAETIYTWIDKEGIKQFSNEPPPESVREYQKIQADVSPPSGQESATGRRQSYDRMVDDAKLDAQRSEYERKRKAEDRKKHIQQKKDQARLAKVNTEKERLEEALEKVRNRGLSRTYSAGMRRNKVEKILKQLDQLNQSPDAYFKEKAAASED